MKKRIEAEDSIAMYCLGNYYRVEGGLAQNYTKALDLWHRAGKLGNAIAYNNIGVAYYNGQGVEVDYKKATYYYELAAIRGNAMARSNLGIKEQQAGNIYRAIKHFLIAVGGGSSKSLKKIQELYSNGKAKKEDYTKALQSYQTYLSEIKSKQRDEAAAYDNEVYRYY